MKSKKQGLLNKLRDWWWLYGVIAAVAGVIVLWGGIPTRLAKAEEKIEDLKDWAKELQGYTRAQQEYNSQVQQAQVPKFQSHIKEWVNSNGVMYCCDESRQDCRLDESWWECVR